MHNIFIARYLFTEGLDSPGGSREGSSAGIQRRMISELTDIGAKQNVDASYNDPLGPAAERPKTAARRRTEDDLDDLEVDENLLPD